MDEVVGFPGYLRFQRRRAGCRRMEALLVRRQPSGGLVVQSEWGCRSSLAVPDEGEYGGMLATTCCSWGHRWWQSATDVCGMEEPMAVLIEEVAATTLTIARVSSLD